MLFERSFKTGRISVKKGSRRVLVKVVLFQLRGPGHPQDDANINFFADSKSPITCRLKAILKLEDDATANFFANSKRLILGLSNEVSFVPEILWKDG